MQEVLQVLVTDCEIGSCWKSNDLGADFSHTLLAVSSHSAHYGMHGSAFKVVSCS